MENRLKSVHKMHMKQKHTVVMTDVMGKFSGRTPGCQQFAVVSVIGCFRVIAPGKSFETSVTFALSNFFVICQAGVLFVICRYL